MKDPPDLLDRQKCLNALASLRHAKWFQVSSLFYLTVIVALCRFHLEHLPLNGFCVMHKMGALSTLQGYCRSKGVNLGKVSSIASTIVNI